MHEAIAIVGLSGRFPGADSVDALWQNLIDGVDSIKAIPSERWRSEDYYDPDPMTPGKMYIATGGFLQSSVDLFDEQFFGISPREAEWMDPQQRILLELAWEALENANISPSSLRGSSTGVFIGASTTDHAHMVDRYGSPEDFSAYWATGTSVSVLAGRISYALGLNGPCLSIDTACSSSLVAIHNACTSLIMRESDCTIAGGISLMLSPGPTIVCCKGGMLALDGRSKTFDSRADGYARSEGAGLVILKRLGDALKANDRILALIRGSSINQNGGSSGLMAPNQSSQEKLLINALNQAALNPSDIDVIEAHGTGTAIGDPVEVGALAHVYTDQSREKPLIIVSGKTNIGHLEAAAGVAGIIKTVLSLKHEAVPAHLHLKQLNPKLPMDSIPGVVPTSPMPWKRQTGRPRRAGVSSFGFSGINAHVILEEAPEMISGANGVERTHHLLTLSAKTEVALSSVIKKYVDHLQTSTDRFADIAHTANVGRAHFNFRCAIVAKDCADGAKKLTEINLDEIPEPLNSLQSKVAFLFTGQGSAYFNMGAELYLTNQKFKDCIDACDAIFHREAKGASLKEALYENDTLIKQPIFAQSCIFAVEYALAELWRSIGITPQALIGHSLGEYVAAVLSGAMPLEAAFKLVIMRAQLFDKVQLNEFGNEGGMLAIRTDPRSIESLLTEWSDLEIGAVNSPRQTVVSGSLESCKKLLKICGESGIHASLLPVTHAFHSAMVQPILDELGRASKGIKYKYPTINWISTVTGSSIVEITVNYWSRNAREPVLFQKAIQKAHESGCTVFIEIGAQPQLLPLVSQCIDNPRNLYLPSLRSSQSAWETMMESLAKFYVNGGEIDWTTLDAPFERTKTELPTYPFQQRVHKLNFLTTANQYSANSPNIHDLLGRPIMIPGTREHRFENTLDLDRARHQHLKDHVILNTIIFPASAYVEIMCAAAKTLLEDGSICIESLAILEPLTFVNRARAKLQVVVTAESENNNVYSAEIYSEEDDGLWRRHAQGDFSVPKNENATSLKPRTMQELRESCTHVVDVTEFYNNLSKAGLEFGPEFRLIESIYTGEKCAFGEVRISEAAVKGKKYHCHEAILDCCFQVMNILGMHPDGLYIPVGISKFILHKNFGDSVYVYTSSAPAEEKNQGHTHPEQSRVQIDMKLFDTCTGELVAEIEQFTTQYIYRPDLQRLLQQEHRAERANLEHVYELHWIQSPTSTKQPSLNGNWLVISEDKTLISTALLEGLRVGGTQCELARFHVKNGAEDNWTDLHLIDGGIVDSKYLKSLKGIIFLQSEDQLGECPPLEQEILCADTINHIQKLQKLFAAMSTRFPELVFVTRGAQVLPNQIECSLQRPLWGLANTMRFEQPDIKSRCIDVDLTGDPREIADFLMQELVHGDKEELIALRGSKRFVGRVVRRRSLNKQGQLLREDRKSLPAVPNINSQYQSYSRLSDGLEQSQSDGKLFQQNQSYVISGGLGALGLELANWLVDQGATHIALLSRKAPNSNLVPRIQLLRTKGAKVSTYQVDIGNASEVEKTLMRIREDRPLHGIFHLAAVLSDGIIKNQTSKKISEVFRAKAHGAWNLHNATRSDPLDYFVLFSSVASLLGSAGQANYAMANGFVDGLAQYRKLHGFPALCINWGAWADIGMAVETSNNRGIKLEEANWIRPEEALSIFGELLADPEATEVGVFRIDWRRLFEFAENASWLNEIKSEFGSKNIVPKTSSGSKKLLAEIQKATEKEKRLIVERYVEEQIRSTLKWPSHQHLKRSESFFDIGMDSLMAVEISLRLQRDLNIHVSTSAVYENPTVELLTRILLVGLINPAQTLVSAAPPK